MVFTGFYSASSGINTTYYTTLTQTTYGQGRIATATWIASNLQCDWFQIEQEPDTTSDILQLPIATPVQYATLVESMITSIQGAPNTENAVLGAGIGSWLSGGAAYVQYLLNSTQIDYLDLHVYPLASVADYINATDAYATTASSFGKRTAISECWLEKANVTDLEGAPAASDPSLFSRDPFSFWSPLDQEFLEVFVWLARVHNMIYISPFWTNYFLAYIDYNPTTANFSSAEISSASDLAAENAIIAYVTNGTNVKTNTSNEYTLLIFAQDALSGGSPSASSNPAGGSFSPSPVGGISASPTANPSGGSSSTLQSVFISLLSSAHLAIGNILLSLSF